MSPLIIGVAFSALCVLVETPAAGQQRPGALLEEILRRSDVNDDGKVTKDEFQGPQQLFERFDRNNDNVLSKDDFAGLREGRAGRPAGFQTPPDVNVLKDVVFGTGGGRDLKMHLVLPIVTPLEPAPVYVWVHGGGWQSGNKEGGVRQVLTMVRNGFVGATIEYRLTGEASFPAQIEDCKCAIRYLRAHAEKYGIDPDRIAVGGSSAGGHLVALLGTSGGVKELEGRGGWEDHSSHVQAVIDLYGPTDFHQFVTTKGYEGHNRDGSPESKLLGGGEVIANPKGIQQVNPITYVDKNDPPFLIIHGSNDPTVPPNQSESLFKALQAARVDATLHVIEDAKHGGPEFGKPEIRDKQLGFLQRVLKSQ